MAKPRHTPTEESRRQVEALTGYGMRQEDICALLRIGLSTLAKYYREELAAGVVRANSQVAQTLFHKAIGGDVTSCIFWLKTRAGWRETSRQEISGPDGASLAPRLEVHFIEPKSEADGR